MLNNFSAHMTVYNCMCVYLNYKAKRLFVIPTKN